MYGWMDDLLVALVLMDEQKRTQPTVQIQIPRNEEKTSHTILTFDLINAARLLRLRILPKPVACLSNTDEFEFFHSV